MHLDRRLLGWGVFFILVGAVPLAVRASLLDPELVRQWPSLWPVLLIAWGLGLLLRHTPVEVIGGALAAITFGIMGGGALASGFAGVPATTGCGGNQPGTVFVDQRGTLAAAGRLNLEFNCGTLAVNPTDGSEWTVGGTAPEGRPPRVETSGTSVTVATDGGGAPFEGGRTNWDVGVPLGVAVGFGLTVNAADATVDLAGASLASANVTANASAVVLDFAEATRLGDVNATVNFGSVDIGLPAGGRSVNLSLNAGNLTVCIPQGAPIRVTWSGTLGANDLEASGLVEVGDNTWVSATFIEGDPHLELRVSANAGSFELDPGGDCDG